MKYNAHCILPAFVTSLAALSLLQLNGVYTKGLASSSFFSSTFSGFKCGVGGTSLKTLFNQIGKIRLGFAH